MFESDDFGDPLDPDAVLDDRGRWLHAVASSMLGNARAHEHDDLYQEGLIAMWRATDSYDPDSGVPIASWLQHKARYRMLDVRNGKRLTGAPEVDRSQASGDARGAASREKISAHLRANPKATLKEISAATGLGVATISYHRKRMGVDAPAPSYSSLEALLDEGFDPATAGDLLDNIVAAYHRGEVAQALDVLTPAERKYVVLRFWHGLSGAELTSAFGYNPGALWTTAKKRLLPALAHLVAA